MHIYPTPTPNYNHRVYRENCDLSIYYDPPLTPAEEVVLSWLQGRAPIGEPVEVNLRYEMSVDLLGDEYASWSLVSIPVSKLIQKGFLELESDQEGRRRIVRVLRTLEQAKIPYRGRNNVDNVTEM